MPSTRQAISQGGVATDPSPVVLIDCAVARAAEVSGLLAQAGYHVSRLGFDLAFVRRRALLRLREGAESYPINQSLRPNRGAEVLWKLNARDFR